MFARLLLALGTTVTLVACAPTTQPPPATPSPVASTSPPPASPPVKPKIESELRVYTHYQDFSGHGYKASGRWYRRVDGAWLTAACNISHVADPKAGPQGGPTCGEWSPVPETQWSAIEKARFHHDEVLCTDKPDVCKDLGVTP